MGSAGFRHRWSGWPGAWCLDCGIADPAEECLAHGKLDYICVLCHESWPQGTCIETKADHQVEQTYCPEHEEAINSWCQEPFSRRYDPYK